MESIQTQPPPGTASLLPGVKVVQIAISQLFRLFDLLTYPESVRAGKFLDTLHNANKMRRAINRRNSFPLGSLGAMRPVAVETEDHFWKGSLPDWREPAVSPLFFLPFELPLRSRLSRLAFLPGSSLEAALAAPGGLVVNWQVDGRLRIYPPGTGVVQISVTATFREAVDIDAVTRIARNLGDLLFVDPQGQERPPNDFFVDVIEQVERSLFFEGTPDRRWSPVHFVLSFRDAQSFDPEPRRAQLAELMSQVPENEQHAGFLESQLREALRSPHWQKERTLAVAGQSVALLVAGLEPRERRARRLDLLAEVRELVAAAVYAEQAFIEKLDEIIGKAQLDDSWLPGQGSGFDYLRRFLDSFFQVKQAIFSIRFLKDKSRIGPLAAFAQDVWAYSNLVRPARLRQRLGQVSSWYASRPGAETSPEIAALRERIRRIQEIEPPFPYIVQSDPPAADPGHAASRKVRVFVSYAHADEKLRVKLVKQLSALQNEGLLASWDDREIGAGTDWEGQIKENLETADIVLFLVSPDLLGSKYVQDVEVRRAMERYQAGTARVIPVILRPTEGWQNSLFGKAEALPEKGKAITLWRPRDLGYAKVAEGIRKAVEEIRSQSS